jgi:hypothetical protein
MKARAVAKYVALSLFAAWAFYETAVDQVERYEASRDAGAP